MWMSRMDSSSLRACVPIVLDRCASFANQDCFLALALHVDRGADAKKLGSFLETVNHHRNCVGHFVARGEDCFLANDFRGEEAFGLVGELVLRKIGRMLRQSLEPGIYEIEAAFAGECRDRKHFGEFEFFAVSRD